MKRCQRNKYPQPVQNQKSDGVALKMRKKVVPKNTSQEYYVNSIYESAVTFGIGPAGTGKTYIAVGVALQMLMDGEIEKIIITRPVVQAGEDLGYLPGTLEEKINPYLLPILDSIKDFVGPQAAQRLMESESIEIAPLAFMRGRTFHNAFIILDEAQNTTHEQMKMFLTRAGFNTKMVVSGDVEQTDLANKSGLASTIAKTRGKSNLVSIVEFTQADCVRSSICSLFTRIL